MITTTITPPAKLLPSEPIVASAEQKLTELATQRLEAEQRLTSLTSRQNGLHQERQELAQKRATLQAIAQRETKDLQQAEVNARLAASSPIGLQTATAKLQVLRKDAKVNAGTRKKALKQIEERQTEIMMEMEKLAGGITNEQGILRELAEQEDMVRVSRINAVQALGEEIYQVHSAKLDELTVQLDQVAAAYIDGQVALREEKEATLTALGPYASLERAITAYDLLDDPLSRLLSAYLALWNVLDVETESEQLVLKVGQSYLPDLLAFSRTEWETILGSPAARAQLIKAKRSAVEQVRLNYLVRH